MSSIAAIIIMVAIFYFFILTRKNPDIVKDKKKLISSVVRSATIGIITGFALITGINTMESLFPTVEGIVIVVIMIAVVAIIFIISYAVAQANAKPKQTHNETNQDSISRVEKLTKLKELLDSGVISQEEFDEKKNQILGL